MPARSSRQFHVDRSLCLIVAVATLPRTAGFLGPQHPANATDRISKHDKINHGFFVRFFTDFSLECLPSAYAENLAFTAVS